MSSSKHVNRFVTTDSVRRAFCENKHKDGGNRNEEKKIAAWILAFMLIWMVTPCALAETDGPRLVSPRVEGLQAEDGDHKIYSVENGLLNIEFLTVDAVKGGGFMVGAVSFW